MGSVKNRRAAARTRHHSYASDDSSVGKVFSIGEVADRFGVTLRAIRFYEENGLIQPLRQNAMRLYSLSDCARLESILTGVRLGFTLRDIKDMMDKAQGRDASDIGLTLEQCQTQLARLQNKRRALDEAIQELSTLIVGMDRRQQGA